MCEIFECNLEIPENNEVLFNIEKDVENSKNFQKSFITLCQLLLNRENETITETHYILTNIKQYLSEVKYLDINTKYCLNYQIKYFEEIYKYRNEKLKNQQKLLKTLIDDYNKLSNLNTEIKKDVKIKFEKSQTKIYSDLNNLSQKPEDKIKIQKSIKEFKFQKLSYLNFLKDSDIFSQMINSTIIIHLFEYLQDKSEKLVDIGTGFKKQSLSLKETFTKNISDFSLNNGISFSHDISNDIFPILKSDYFAEGYLTRRNKIGNPVVIYANMCKPFMNLSVIDCDGRANKPRLLEIKKCQGDIKMNELRIISGQEKYYIFNAFNEENLQAWVKKLNGTIISKSETIKKKPVAEITKEELKSNIVLKIDIVRILITTIENEPDNVYSSKSHIDKNYILPSDFDTGNYIYIMKLSGAEAFLALRYYIENSDSLIPNEIYLKYVVIEKVNSENLKTLIKLIPEKNFQILSLLFNHFKKIVNMRKSKCVPITSLSAIFAQIMNKSLVLNNDPSYTIVKKCNLFTDLYANAKDLFPENLEIENDTRNQITNLKSFIKQSREVPRAKSKVVGKFFNAIQRITAPRQYAKNSIYQESLNIQKVSHNNENKNSQEGSTIKNLPENSDTIIKNVAIENKNELVKIPNEIAKSETNKRRKLNKIDSKVNFRNQILNTYENKIENTNNINKGQNKEEKKEIYAKKINKEENIREKVDNKDKKSGNTKSVNFNIEKTQESIFSHDINNENNNFDDVEVMDDNASENGKEEVNYHNQKIKSQLSHELASQEYSSFDELDEFEIDNIENVENIDQRETVDSQLSHQINNQEDILEDEEGNENNQSDNEKEKNDYQAGLVSQLALQIIEPDDDNFEDVDDDYLEDSDENANNDNENEKAELDDKCEEVKSKLSHEINENVVFFDDVENNDDYITESESSDSEKKCITDKSEFPKKNVKMDDNDDFNSLKRENKKIPPLHKHGKKHKINSKKNLESYKRKSKYAAIVSKKPHISK